MADGDNEFYSVDGAARLRERLPQFTEGHAVIGVCDAPFKCPPAPSETALLLHDYLSERGLRERCQISFVIPFGMPVPPSLDTSRALLAAFAERDIEFIPNRRIGSLDVSFRVARLDDGSEILYDLFLGVPKHRAPDVVLDSGMAENGYVPVDSRTLATIRGGEQPDPYDGRGSCYIEFGAGRVGRVDVDFLSAPKPTGSFQEPSAALVAEKQRFGSDRRARWFA